MTRPVAKVTTEPSVTEAETVWVSAEPGGPEGVGAGHELDREGPVGPGGAEGVPGAAAVVAEREARPQRVARAVEGAQGDPGRWRR